MKRIAVNFDKKIKPIKELHGVNCAPYRKMKCENQALVKECFEEIGIPSLDCTTAKDHTAAVISSMFLTFSATLMQTRTTRQAMTSITATNILKQLLTQVRR